MAKQSRQGRAITEFFFPSFQPNITICPVHTLQKYLARTRQLRGAELRLFVSFIKPHKAVTSSTIARWLWLTLEQSGIDSSIFGDIPSEEHRLQLLRREVLLQKIFLKQQTGALSPFSKGFTTRRWIRQPMVGLLSTRIARSKLQTTQLMCETEPSEI